MTTNFYSSEDGAVSSVLQPAVVVYIDEQNEKIYLRLLDDNCRTFSEIDTREFYVGAVCVIEEVGDESYLHLAPESLLHGISWVGVVRFKSEENTLVEVRNLLRRVPTNDDQKYKVGDTVEAREAYGVVRVIAPNPISTEASSSNLLDQEDFAASIRTEPSKEQGPRYEDFAGYDELKRRVRGFVKDSLVDRKPLTKLGAKPGKGVLFTGEPGTGKTFLARIIANEEGATFYPIKGPEVVNKYYGQTEEFLRQIFGDAKKQENAIIFFDEWDSIAANRDDLTHDFSRSVVAQLLTLLDGHESDNIFVIATTNRPSAIDPALKRPGRLDKVIGFPLPEKEDREEILLSYTLRNTADVRLPYEHVAEQTHGWTPAELESIWQAAARCAVREGRKTVKLEDYMRGFDQARFERSEVSRSGRPRRSEGEQ